MRTGILQATTIHCLQNKKPLQVVFILMQVETGIGQTSQRKMGLVILFIREDGISQIHKGGWVYPNFLQERVGLVKTSQKRMGLVIFLQERAGLVTYSAGAGGISKTSCKSRQDWFKLSARVGRIGQFCCEGGWDQSKFLQKRVGLLKFSASDGGIGQTFCWSGQHWSMLEGGIGVTGVGGGLVKLSVRLKKQSCSQLYPWP